MTGRTEAKKILPNTCSHGGSYETTKGKKDDMGDGLHH